MTILPLTYLGSTEYFRRLYGGECVIDLYEHYVKQSYRNRCDILTAGGPASLSVHVVKGGSIHKRPVRDMRIDYSKRWQHQHWMSILSAYKNSPYFDHYRARFEPLYNREFTFLADWNTALLERLFAVLGTPPDLRFSDSYVEAGSADCDLRSAFEPLRREHPATTGDTYEQVFSDRFPFVPALSVIDLLFCEGPAAKEFLLRPSTPPASGISPLR